MDYPDAIKIGGREYKVFYERALKGTSSVRLRGGRVILRLSRYSFGRARDETVAKFLKWARKRLNKISISDFVEPSFTNGSSIVTHNKIYELRAEVDSKGRRKSMLLNGSVIDVCSKAEFEIRELAEKIIMKDQTSYLHEVVEELNQLYFRQKYNLVRFKRVSSRFGSCSSKRNINIAVKLLYFPRSVFRYVCVHELAHLVEMNHSAGFWELVECAMPDYKLAEKWLAENGFAIG